MLHCSAEIDAAMLTRSSHQMLHCSEVIGLDTALLRSNPYVLHLGVEINVARPSVQGLLLPRGVLRKVELKGKAHVIRQTTQYASRSYDEVDEPRSAIKK